MSNLTHELARFRIDDLLREAAARRRASESREELRGAKSAFKRRRRRHRLRALRQIVEPIRTESTRHSPETASAQQRSPDR